VPINKIGTQLYASFDNESNSPNKYQKQSDMYAEAIMRNKSHSKLRQIFTTVGAGNFVNDVMTIYEDQSMIYKYPYSCK
jgi:hypothetical protein